jgi:hypothetical protein
LELPRTAVSCRDTPPENDEIQIMNKVDSFVRDFHFADEGTLLTSVLRRDPAAWAELVVRYEPAVRRAIRRTLIQAAIDGESAAPAVRDIVSAVYHGLVEGQMARLRTFDPDAGLLGDWLDGWAESVATAWVRHARRAQA